MTAASTPCTLAPTPTQHIVDNGDNKGLTPVRTGTIQRVGATSQDRFSAIFGEKVRLASLSPHRHSPRRARLALISRRKPRSIHAAGQNQRFFAALFPRVKRREFQHAFLPPPFRRAGGP